MKWTKINVPAAANAGRYAGWIFRSGRSQTVRNAYAAGHVCRRAGRERCTDAGMAGAQTKSKKRADSANLG